MDLAWQKFRAAALLLARSGTVKERLYAAYRHQLCDLEVDTLPNEVRDDFCALMRTLTRERPAARRGCRCRDDPQALGE
jgi:hypothetical protein